MEEMVVCHEINVPLLKKTFEKYPAVRSAILSAVKDYPEEADAFLKQNTYFLKLDSHTPLPVKILYKTPRKLGKDRIALAVAAYATFPGENVLVIDAGTTITYDVVNNKGEYLGGAISPGIRMRLKALHTFTGKLPLIEEPDTIPDWVGNDTRSAILSGVLNGVLAETEGFIQSYQARFPQLKIVLSGGDEKYFDKRLKNNIFALPNFVITGLKEILDYNEEKREN
jgi:type III pantothenate kinase